MADAVHIPVGPNGIPPVPASAQFSAPNPAAPGMTPGFVPPKPDAPAAPAAAAPAPGTFTQEQVNALLAAALANKGEPAAPTQLLSPSAAIAPPQLTSTTDPVLSSMQAMFSASGTGVDIDRAIGKALQYGDPALVDVAYLNEKGGAQAANLVVMAKAMVERVQSQAQAGEQAVFAAAGGEQAWHASAAVFNQGAPAHLKLVVKAMLDSGSQAQMEAGAKMVVDYSQASGRVPVVPGLVAAGAAGLGNAQGLSREAFQAAHFKLDPNSRNYVAEKNELLSRRAIGKQLGM